ncbi:MAG: four helix bundle protein [Gemmatimonadetes bacterium]|nr:four helix bundle protein [Gemmatimonadota bacterium]
MRNPENLRVYQQALALAIELGPITRQFPEDLDFIVPQVRTAANSIHASIAEGMKRGTEPDKARFLDIANGSTSELRSHLLEVRGTVPNAVRVEWAQAECESISRQLSALIVSIRGRRSSDDDRVK